MISTAHSWFFLASNVIATLSFCLQLPNVSFILATCLPEAYLFFWMTNSQNLHLVSNVQNAVITWWTTFFTELGSGEDYWSAIRTLLLTTIDIEERNLIASTEFYKLAFSYSQNQRPTFNIDGHRDSGLARERPVDHSHNSSDAWRNPKGW